MKPSKSNQAQFFIYRIIFRFDREGEVGQCKSRRLIWDEAIKAPILSLTRETGWGKKITGGNFIHPLLTLRSEWAACWMFNGDSLSKKGFFFTTRVLFIKQQESNSCVFVCVSMFSWNDYGVSLLTLQDSHFSIDHSPGLLHHDRNIDIHLFFGGRRRRRRRREIDLEKMKRAWR